MEQEWNLKIIWHIYPASFTLESPEEPHSKPIKSAPVGALPPQASLLVKAHWNSTLQLELKTTALFKILFFTDEETEAKIDKNSKV